MGQKDVLSEAEYETLAEFRYMLRRFLNRSAAAARSANLTPHQHQALLAIRGYAGGAISIGELAEKLMVKHHTAGELVERLLRAGLVERRADPADRRRALVSLSARARGLLATLSTTHLEELRRYNRRCSDCSRSWGPANSGTATDLAPWSTQRPIRPLGQPQGARASLTHQEGPLCIEAWSGFAGFSRGLRKEMEIAAAK